MFYAAYKTGFQSAGISNPGTVPNLAALPIDVANDTLVFDATDVEGFEFGMKGRFMDNRLNAELAVFRYESEDLQVGYIQFKYNDVYASKCSGSFEPWIEAQAVFRANESWDLRASMTYAHLEFDDWANAGCHPVDGARTDLAQQSAPGCHIGSDGVAIQDLSGVKYGGPLSQ